MEVVYGWGCLYGDIYLILLYKLSGGCKCGEKYLRIKKKVFIFAIKFMNV